MTERKKQRRAPRDKNLKLAEEAVFKRAVGGSHEEISTEEQFDRDSGTMQPQKRRSTSKVVLPDVRALLFYLKNRCPERWNERRGEPPEEEFEFEAGEDERDL